MHTPEVNGSCQCGAVRFHLAAGETRANVCHCRMCQRASGNAFAALLMCEDAMVTWYGTPATYASSSIAHRGFCANCGTPMFYRQHGGPTEIMSGCLPPDFPFQPTQNDGVESRHAWVNTLGTLPDNPTREELTRATPYQSPETP